MRFMFLYASAGSTALLAAILSYVFRDFHVEIMRFSFWASLLVICCVALNHAIVLTFDWTNSTKAAIVLLRLFPLFWTLSRLSTVIVYFALSTAATLTAMYLLEAVIGFGIRAILYLLIPIYYWGIKFAVKIWLTTWSDLCAAIRQKPTQHTDATLGRYQPAHHFWQIQKAKRRCKVLRKFHAQDAFGAIPSSASQELMDELVSQANVLSYRLFKRQSREAGKRSRGA